MEKSFVRPDGSHFELKQSGDHTMIWEVTKDGKFQRFETWRLQEVRGGNPHEFDPDEVGLHNSFTKALSEYEKNENNNY